MTRRCLDCSSVFSASGRMVRCRACQWRRNDEHKRESQRRRMQVKRHNEPHDISAEEIEARFQAALKEVRAQRSEALEPFRSYGWLYREPRS